MSLITPYLGLNLPHPFVLGASPIVDDLDAVRRAEDAGAAAIVMHSLFEEQITLEQSASESYVESRKESFAEALDYLPDAGEFTLTPDAYLEQLRRVKAAVGVPVFASLNGITNQGWLEYAALFEQAGADGVELNVYQLATDPEEPGEAIEQRTLDMIQSIKKKCKLPVAVKLSPFYTALSHFARRLEAAGVDGLVLFNRFYQPDIDIEALNVNHHLELSTSSELLLRLRWLAILSAQVKTSLAVTGGVHTSSDAIKASMAGAHAIQLVSEVLRNGTGRFRDLIRELGEWLEEHEYESLSQLRGNMNLARCPNSSSYERANYMHVLHSWGRSPAR